MKHYSACKTTPLEDAQAGVTPNATVRRQYPWTQMHSHYALMGGYVFDTSGSLNFFPNGRTRLSLTPTALLKIAELEPDLLPNLPKSNIEDKSKADGLAKTIVCVQALWYVVLPFKLVHSCLQSFPNAGANFNSIDRFIVQTIGRLATSNPTSLLEMNTLLHALCCFAIYAAWWHKPLDIEEPTTVELSSMEHKQLAAWMLMQSKLGKEKIVHRKDKQGVLRRTTKTASLISHGDLESTTGNMEPTQLGAENVPQVPVTKILPSECRVHPAIGRYTLHNTQEMFGHRLWNKEPSKSDGYCVFLTTEDIKCLELAHAFRTQIDTQGRPWKLTSPDANFLLPGGSFSFSSNSPLKELPPLDELSNTWRLPDRYDSESVDMFILVALAAAACFYGGLHLLAWNAPFPTKTEKALWRASGIIVAAPFPVLLVGIIITSITKYILKRMSRAPHHEALPTQEKKRKESSLGRSRHPIKLVWLVSKCIITCFGGMIILVGIEVVEKIIILVYVVARTYLVVECFVNLAHLPEAVFKEPEWSKVFPHFGSG